MKWSEEQTINFVRQYIKYECLYNVHCPEYKVKQLRQAALLNLSTSLGITGFGPKDAYLKIRSLKSTYAQEIKKIKSYNRSSDGSSNIYTPNIKWFHILHDALMAVNSTVDYRQSSSFEASIPEIQLTENAVKYDNEESSFAASQEKDYNPQIHKGTYIKKKPRKRTFMDYDNLLYKVQNVANAAAKPVEPLENEFDIFGKSVAAQLKNMPLDMAIEAQSFMQNYLSDMRLRTLRPITYNSQGSSSSHSNHYLSQSSPQTSTPIYHLEQSPERTGKDIDVTSYKAESSLEG